MTFLEEAAKVVNSWLTPALKWSERLSFGIYLLIVTGFITLQAVALLAMGQPLICPCGYVKLWHGVVISPENSQHITDWYTHTHIIHGIGFYLLLWLIVPRLPMGMRFTLAIGLEVGWEIFENTPFIIDRYRQSALAQGYFGDSVINSVFDAIATALGFILARILPVWSAVALAIVMELLAGYMIRDNLMLNIIQLFHPNDTISNWQSGR